MFENCISIYALKQAVAHQMNMIGCPLQGWTWEDEVSHHNVHHNMAAVDILNEGINRREELKAQKKNRGPHV